MVNQAAPRRSVCLSPIEMREWVLVRPIYKYYVHGHGINKKIVNFNDLKRTVPNNNIEEVPVIATLFTNPLQSIQQKIQRWTIEFACGLSLPNAHSRTGMKSRGGSLNEAEMRICVAAQTPGGSKCDHNLLMDPVPPPFSNATAMRIISLDLHIRCECTHVEEEAPLLLEWVQT